MIFEAFAAGIPVVATNLGGMSEFVRHEKTGCSSGWRTMATSRISSGA